eukprot:1161603-Pelagomonas_calceolata.AAC.10
MAGSGARILLFQAKMGSIMLPHRDHLNPTTSGAKLLDNMVKNGVNRESGCHRGCQKWLKARPGFWLPSCAHLTLKT